MCPVSPENISLGNNSSDENTLAEPDIPTWIPPNLVCKSAYILAFRSLPAAILNHSIRVYFYASHFAKTSQLPSISPDKLDFLFIACILHDIGAFASSPSSCDVRFEVDGADCAAVHLRKHNLDESDIHQVWTAIALHTSPHIAERIGELPRLVRLAVLEDFQTDAEKRLAGELRPGIESTFPRQEAEKVLGNAVVKQALECPRKAPPSTWPGGLLTAKLEEPEWEGINKAF